MSKLTILLPVYNSISRNGDGYLKAALDSLLAQTFKDFEIHILDNISTDNTAEICQEYANKDKRIKFRIDNEQRFPEGGINKLAEDVNTEFMMIANCDDLWNHYYIETLLSILEKNKNLAAVYSNGNFINKQNHVGNALIPDTRFTYVGDRNINFCLGIQHRGVIPILFGIFRTAAYKSALPYKPFDDLKANVDNLFLLKFLLNGHKTQLCDKDLFYYRDRQRKFDPNKFPNIPKSPILVWVYYIIHQLNFYTTVKELLPNNNPLLNIVAIDSCLRHIPNTIKWIIKDLNPDKFETSILITLYERYECINSLLLKTSYPQFTEDLCKETCKKIRIFRKYILQYIYDIMQHNEIIDIAIKKIEDINIEFENILNGIPNNH